MKRKTERTENRTFGNRTETQRTERLRKTTTSTDRSTVVVAGASGGIGRALVETYRGENVALYLQANRGAERLRSELSADSGFSNVRVFSANLASDGGVDSFCGAVFDALKSDQKTDRPRLDAFVDAAGVDLMSPESKAASFEERLARVWALDVAAAIRTARFFGRLGRDFRRANPSNDRRPAALVLFGWDGIERGMEGETAQLYAAGKGAVVAFARSLAQDLAPFVRVDVVSPGWIRTTWGAVASESASNRGASESLSGRWGTAAEVAAVVRFLTSDAASYLNGQNIVLNGGFSYRKN